MVSFEIIRPAGIASRLLSFKFYFENMNTHIIDMVHAGGMNLVYDITKTCYVYPQNEFYELLELKNTEELHELRYNWLLMQGKFGIAGSQAVAIEIENEETLNLLHPNNSFDKKYLFISKMPEPGNEIVINDKTKTDIFHHFKCNEILARTSAYPASIIITYLNSYSSVDDVLNLWFDEENKLMPLR